MRPLFLFLFILLAAQVQSQAIDSINIPRRVIYKYSDPLIIEKAKQLIIKEFSDSATYALDNGIVVVGPTLWSRYQNIPALKAIPNGNVTIRVNSDRLAAKMTQDKAGFKKIWDHIRSEVGGSEFTLRKLTFNEIDYYWTVISFDIEEPLLVVETNNHRYILNLSPKDLKLLWLDEVPSTIK